MISERQKEIITILEEQTDWITMLQISKLIGCSDKTIHSDIKVLNKTLPNNWKIIMKRGQGAKLKKPSNESIDILVNVDSDIKLIKTLIEKILSKNDYTVETLGLELYINTKTISDLLKKVDKILKPHLVLSRNPLKIHGPELMKRLLIYNLEKKVYGETTLFYNLYRENQQLFNDVNKHLEKQNILLYPLPLAKFLIFVKISIARYQEGFTIESISNPNYIKQLKIYRNFLTIFDIIESHLNVQLNESEYLNVFFTFIYSEFYFKNITDAPKETINYIRSNPSKHKELIEFIEYLGAKLNYTFIEDDNLVLSIYDAYKKNQLRSINELYEYAGSRPSSLLAKEKFLNLYLKLEAICLEWTHLKNVSLYTIDFVSTLTLIVQRFMLESGVHQQKIAYIYSETLDLKNITVVILNKKLINDIYIQPIPLDNWSHKLNQQYDLILTDTPLEKSNEKFILINKLPSARDLNIINNHLRNNGILKN